MISTEHKKVLSDILYRAGLFCISTFFSQTTDFDLKSALLLHTETPSIEKKEEREEKSEENKKKRWFSVENIVSFGADDGT